MSGRQSWWRHEICRVGRSLFERRHVHGTAGNISVRLAAADGGGFLITPTDACLGFLDPQRLAHVDEAGWQIGGDKPSKTLALHRSIYAASSHSQCVLHTHSTHLVALTLSGRIADIGSILPPITPYQVMKVGRVPLVPCRRPGDPAVVDEVRSCIAAALDARRDLRAVMLDRLGPVAWHATPGEAMAVLEELEEAARLWLLCQPSPAPLGEQQVAEIEAAFNVVW